MTGCQFCAQIPAEGRTGVPAGTPSFPEGDYRVAAGCLRALHVRVYLACAWHMDIFANLYQGITCPDCELVPGEISYLDQMLWRKEEDEEQVREPGADRHREAVPEARVLGHPGGPPGV